MWKAVLRLFLHLFVFFSYSCSQDLYVLLVFGLVIALSAARHFLWPWLTLCFFSALLLKLFVPLLVDISLSFSAIVGCIEHIVHYRTPFLFVWIWLWYWRAVLCQNGQSWWVARDELNTTTTEMTWCVSVYTLNICSYSPFPSLFKSPTSFHPPSSPLPRHPSSLFHACSHRPCSLHLT